jgi:hypothetical protein
MRGTKAVTINARNFFTQVDLANLLFDKTHVAHVASGICTKHIDLAGGPGGVHAKTTSGRRTARVRENQ